MRYRPAKPAGNRLSPLRPPPCPPPRAGEGWGGGARPPPRAGEGWGGGTSLLLYAAAVLLASVVHRSDWLAGMLLVTLLLCGRDAPRLLLKSIKVVLVFNLAVGAGYAALAAWRGIDPWPTVLLINLRVVLLTLLGFLLMARVNLFRALAFSRTLSYLLGLAYSQTLTFRRAHDDFRLALISRSPRRPSLADRYRASAAAASWFIDKAIHGARENAQALRSRGFFDA